MNSSRIMYTWSKRVDVERKKRLEHLFVSTARYRVRSSLTSGRQHRCVLAHISRPKHTSLVRIRSWRRPSSSLVSSPLVSSYLGKVKDNVEFAHVGKVRVQELDKQVDGFQKTQFIFMSVHLATNTRHLE
jgi:hypothetical protein